MTATKSYNAADITALEGLEPVRVRPGMYIGGVDTRGLHHLCWEILDNSVDEAMNGHASEITLTLHAGKEKITVADNGRGIPVDKHPKTKKPALEMVLTELHAGGKFEGQNYKTSGGLHGVGASVVNALSKKLTATVKRGGGEYRMEFSKGKPTTKLLKKKSAARGTGTTITFEPDATIFPRIDFDAETIRQRLEVVSFLHKGVKVHFVDDDAKTKTTFQHANGIADYLDAVQKQRQAKPIHDAAFAIEREVGDVRLEAVFRWTDATDEHLRSYVNGIPTGSGGSHEAGLRAAINKAVRNFIDTHKLTPRGVKITPDDIREGVVGILSVFIPDPQFQGQTKDRLNNPEVQPAVDNAVRPALEQWLNENRSVGDTIVARIVNAARARAASRAAADAITRKTVTSSNRLTLPGKLADCTSSNRHGAELFIVEGDSAGGSAKQGRDRKTQAILPLRGKVLNTESQTLTKVLTNKELADLVTALGCGIGKHFDPGKLRYQRIILLADADSDGHHITTLLLTFFFRHLRPLVEDGFVFIAVPPLYRVEAGKQRLYAADEAERDAFLASLKGNAKPEITRFKGLGEMMAKDLWETTLNPETRRLLRVDITDALAADRVMDELMGKDPSARFRFIMDRAEDADDLDV
ncbi:MAG: DNA topoisomerase IV subunit B [Planctomycetota bacterium]